MGSTVVRAGAWVSAAHAQPRFTNGQGRPPQGGAVCVWDCTPSERELFEAAAGLLRKRVSVPAEDLYKRLHPDVRTVSSSMTGGMQRGT